VNTTAILEDLDRRGVKVWVEGEDLRYRGPKKALTPEVLAELKAHKTEIISALRPPERKTVASSFDKLQAGLQRSSGLSPLAYALRRALHDHAAWRGESPSGLAVALWAHELVEGKPTREEVAEALEELRGRRAA
jgi:hypothetical protein